MPKLIRLYIVNVITGFGLAALLVAAILWLDVAHLRHLVTTSDQGLLALFLLWFFHGIVFAGVQFAIAIMNMAEDDEPRGGLRLPVLKRVVVRKD